MAGFVKVYDSILESSVWGESLSVRVVWIAMLAMSDRNGLVAASSDGISRRANVPLKATEQALSVLESPDIRSKSQDFEGRRVARVDGGYQILNYLKYRELRTDKQKATAERQRRWRERHSDTALRNGDITPVSRAVTPKAKAKAEAKADTKAETTKTTTVAAGAPNGQRRVAPEKPKAPWVAEGADWWRANVGAMTYGRFGRALGDEVRERTWPVVFEAMKCYAKNRKGALKVEWFAGEMVKWCEWANMKITDEYGDLTPLGQAMRQER